MWETIPYERASLKFSIITAVIFVKIIRSCRMKVNRNFSTQIELDRFSHLPLQTLTARKNVFVQICSGQICNKYIQTERQIWGKNGKYLICFHIMETTLCFWFANLAFTIIFSPITPVFSHFCEVLAWGKFVQIPFYKFWVIHKPWLFFTRNAILIR